VRAVSFYYFHADGRCETLASARAGDRQAIMEAERSAKRKAMDIQSCCRGFDPHQPPHCPFKIKRFGVIHQSV